MFEADVKVNPPKNPTVLKLFWLKASKGIHWN